MKNKQNLIYGGILVLLIIIYAAIKLGNYKPEKNFDSTSIAIMDTSKIAKIFISSQSEPNGVYVIKKGEKWIVKKDSLQATADINTVVSMLSELANLNIESVVATSSDKWKDYELTDSAATIVKLFDAQNNPIQELYIGKFRFKRTQTPYGAGTNGTPYTFVRTNKSDDVYLVKGMLSITFNRNFNNLRNQMILKLVKNDIEKIRYTMPQDTGYYLAKKDSAWLINGKDTADFNKVDSYLNMVGWLSDSHFDDNFVPKNDPVYTVTYEGKNFTPITIRIYQKDSLNYVVNSTYNPESYFVTLKEHLVDRLIKPKDFFVKTNKKH
jgi:hypothetical protein